MATGGFGFEESQKDHGGKVTAFVLITCFVAATGGLMFGYDLGIIGGVTSMDAFLKKLFPSVYRRMMDATTDDNEYCKFESRLLTTFTSSMYLAALVASLCASSTTRVFGRKTSMCLGGLVFLLGSVLSGAATNTGMLLIGRLLLGVGIGFANQSVPLYLSEMAPPKLRGALNIGFQMAITAGIFIANLVNYVTSKIKGQYGWRVSLTLAAVPAIIMTVGSLVLPDTPNSLMERGFTEKAKTMLQMIRGTEIIDDEFQDLIEASEASKQAEHPWKKILQPRYRPHLIMSMAIPFFQQVTGINVVVFYAPALFKTLGFGDDASIMSVAIIGLINLFGTFVSIFTVDKYGRRFLFLEGGVQMIICQVLLGIILALKFGSTGEGNMTKGSADLVLFLICSYVAGFAWSWGPLGWLVPSEIFPLEIRSVGQSITVSMNMFFTFCFAQGFLTIICHLKSGLFFFFTGSVFVMTLFILFFLPETKKVPIEEMNRAWKQHWFWGRYIPDEAIIGSGIKFQQRRSWLEGNRVKLER